MKTIRKPWLLLPLFFALSGCDDPSGTYEARDLEWPLISARLVVNKDGKGTLIVNRSEIVERSECSVSVNPSGSHLTLTCTSGPASGRSVRLAWQAPRNAWVCENCEQIPGFGKSNDVVRWFEVPDKS